MERLSHKLIDWLEDTVSISSEKEHLEVCIEALSEVLEGMEMRLSEIKEYGD